MAKRPFSETPTAAASGTRASAAASDKSEFEDKVHQDFDIFKQRIDILVGKQLNPKPEKDEGADKFASDKGRKDTKDNKHEKLEKEHKELLKDADGGVFGALSTAVAGFADPNPAQTAQLMARIAALEAEMGAMRHFIGKDQRPDIATGALKDEPEE